MGVLAAEPAARLLTLSPCRRPPARPLRVCRSAGARSRIERAGTTRAAAQGAARGMWGSGRADVIASLIRDPPVLGRSGVLFVSRATARLASFVRAHRVSAACAYAVWSVHP